MKSPSSGDNNDAVWSTVGDEDCRRQLRQRIEQRSFGRIPRASGLGARFGSRAGPLRIVLSRGQQRNVSWISSVVGSWVLHSLTLSRMVMMRTR